MLLASHSKGPFFLPAMIGTFMDTHEESRHLKGRGLSVLRVNSELYQVYLTGAQEGLLLHDRSLAFLSPYTVCGVLKYTELIGKWWH